MNSWVKQVSSLLNSSSLGYVRMLKRLTFTFATRNYVIGILRKGCFVIPWCVVSVIPATVMYRKHKKLVKHICSLQKTSAEVNGI